MLDKGRHLGIPDATVAVSISRARELLGADLLSLEQVCGALGQSADRLSPEVRKAAAEVPFSDSDLERAKGDGQALVFRLDRDDQGPLTIQRLIDRFPAAFEARLLTKVGYALRDEWGITLEPLAKSEVCAPGWYLAGKQPLAESCNLSYYEQDEPLARFAERAPGARRRTAVEATYDLVLHHAVHGVRLLEDHFDWTSSRTVDAGYLYVGGFGDQGLSLVGFSAAVRHATLGVCPTRGAA